MTERASEHVLYLPELLEQILLYLPTKDILLAQRVNTAFNTTIRCSTKLQKTLFFQPEWNHETKQFNAYANHNHPGVKPANNRLLLRAFSGCYPTVSLTIINADTDADGRTPLVPRKGSEQWQWDCCISFPAETLPSCSPAVNYPEASWRRMYLSQPPCTTLHLVRRWQRSIKPAIVREAGIRMGEFYIEATKKQEKWHQSYISSDQCWHFEGNIKSTSILDSCSFTYTLTRRSQRGADIQVYSDDWDALQLFRSDLST